MCMAKLFDLKLIAFVLAALMGMVPLYARGESADSIPTIDLDEFVVEASNIVTNTRGYRIRSIDGKLKKGKSIQEILPYLPNLSLHDGALQINGIAANEIKIDGRKVYDLSELKDLSADIIESVEVNYTSGADKITNNVGGTIEIHLKEVPPKGYYGNIQAVFAKPFDANSNTENVSGNISMRSGQLNLFDGISTGLYDIKDTYHSVLESPTDVVDYDGASRYKTKSLNNNFGLGYNISKSHLVSLNNQTFVRRRDIEDTPDSRMENSLFSKNNIFSNVLSVNYDGKLNGAADRLHFTMDWLYHQEKEEQIVKNPLEDSYSGERKNRSNFLKGSFGYTHVFHSNHKLNGGISCNYFDIRTDHFSGRDVQTIRAFTPLVYASMEGNVGSFGYYAGLNWQMNTVKVVSGGRITQNSVNPTVQLSFPIWRNNRNNLVIIYKHILDNIPYDALSDKKVWVDSYNYYIGNSALKAPTEHYASVGVSLLDNLINLNGSYMRDENTIFWQTFNDPENVNVLYTKPVNVSPVNIYAVRAEVNYRPFDCWMIKGIARVAFNTENFKMNGITYDTTRLRQFYSIYSSLSLKNDWGGYVNAYVEPTFRDFANTYRWVYQVDCSIYKTFLNNRLQLILNVTPLGRRRTLERRLENQTVSMKYTGPVQTAGLRVVWYFSGGKKNIDIDIHQSSLDYQELKSE